MKKLALLSLVAILLAGCTVHRGGSQALSFDPSNFGTSQPVFSPANNHQFADGEQQDLRR